MKSFKVAEKLMMRPDAPERWSLDVDVKVKRAIVPAGTTGDLKMGYRYAHFVPFDTTLPKISWDSTKRSRLPITPEHKPIICSECGRHCSHPDQTFEELRKVTPW